MPTTGDRPPLDHATCGTTLTFHRAVRFVVGGRPTESPAAALVCNENRLEPTFVALCAAIDDQLSLAGLPRPRDVVQALSPWEHLLRQATRLCEEAELGLWGELTTILRMPDLDAAVRAWRAGETGLDFVGGGVGLDAKASRRRLLHEVSQSQLSRPERLSEVFFLSLWTGIDPVGGTTLPQLVDHVSNGLADPARFELKLLRSGYSRGVEHEYREAYMLLDEPIWFRDADVPRVTAWQPGVSAIRFTAAFDEDRAFTGDSAELCRRLCGATAILGSSEIGAVQERTECDDST